MKITVLGGPSEFGVTVVEPLEVPPVDVVAEPEPEPEAAPKRRRGPRVNR